MWLVHETGHIVAARMFGLVVHAVWFIPFVGAIMLMVQALLMREKTTEAKVGIAGPISGFIGTSVGYLLLALFGERLSIGMQKDVSVILLLSVAYNLLQLVITIRPFDGGRVTQIIHPGFRIFALLFLGATTVLWPRSWLIVVWLLVLTDLRFFHQWRRVWVSFALTVLLFLGLFIGFGRDAWWWNATDLILCFLTLAWALGQAKKDPKHWRALPEWRVIVSISKRILGSWSHRGVDRRHVEDRRKGKRGDRRNGDRRSRNGALPIDLSVRDGEFVDRRSRPPEVTRSTRLLWLAVYLGTIVAYFGLAWMIYDFYLVL
jgi:hypothetical protein